MFAEEARVYRLQQLLQEQFELDPGFKRAVDRLEVVYAFAFSPTATKCIELLMTDLTASPLSVLDEPLGEAFGFFCQAGDRFQMTIPKDTNSEEIKAALLHLANTEDQNFILHPEHLVQCMDRGDVLDWQARLNRLPHLQRMADRAILLDGANLTEPRVGRRWEGRRAWLAIWQPRSSRLLNEFALDRPK